MTNLNEVSFGLNKFCGPAVLSILTGESTDHCAAVISSISGKKEIKAVDRHHLKAALEKLRFDVSDTIFGGSTLYGCLYRMRTSPGMYVVIVPHHVVAVEVKEEQIYICDNHTKQALDIRHSARLTQKVDSVWRVSRREAPTLIRTEIRLTSIHGRVELYKDSIYVDSRDNVEIYIGGLRVADRFELISIIEKLEELKDKMKHEAMMRSMNNV